jgi:hypothetical protein
MHAKAFLTLNAGKGADDTTRCARTGGRSQRRRLGWRRSDGKEIFTIPHESVCWTRVQSIHLCADSIDRSKSNTKEVLGSGAWRARTRRLTPQPRQRHPFSVSRICMPRRSSWLDTSRISASFWPKNALHSRLVARHFVKSKSGEAIAAISRQDPRRTIDQTCGRAPFRKKKRKIRHA